jgi:hypothetical protein
VRFSGTVKRPLYDKRHILAGSRRTPDGTRELLWCVAAICNDGVVRVGVVHRAAGVWDGERWRYPEPWTERRRLVNYAYRQLAEIERNTKGDGR